ncbi:MULTISPECIES: hypothetical protein [Capnocytophaga]|uniref:hypothetical protein n=1 Tax=Capnocytophaga TaxID=1016 RepID=UPI000BB1B8FC|nr:MULTISPECIES: hypothetical protein [Capnocytophaga]ATA75498.1 hypothetical protein CGC52_08775 [Capnocytophaga sp. H2931]
MKKVILFLVLIFALYSCGTDKLTEAKVKDLVQACIEKEPQKDVVDAEITLGEGQLLATMLRKSDNEKNYLQLSDEKLIDFEKTNQMLFGQSKYNISLTEKGKQYVTRTEKNKTWVRCLSLKLSEVEEIHENPSTNTAEVKLVFRKENKTPFHILLSDDLKSDEPIKRTMSFRKTNEGWKLCD